MMILTLALSMVQSEDPYRTIVEGNMYAPAPAPVAAPEPERTPPPPEAPRTRNVEIVGFLWDPVDEVRRVLLCDMFDPDTAYFYLKAGDEYLGAQIQTVEAGEVAVMLEGEARTLRIGDSFQVLDRQRPPEGTGRLVEIHRGLSGAAAAPAGGAGQDSGERPSLRDRLQRLRERRQP